MSTPKLATRRQAGFQVSTSSEPSLSAERKEAAPIRQATQQVRLPLTAEEVGRLPAPGPGRDAYLLSAWLVLMYKHSGHTDISLGIAGEGQARPFAELRMRVDPSQSFAELAAATQRACRAVPVLVDRVRNAFASGVAADREIALSDASVSELHIAVQVEGRVLVTRLDYNASQFSQRAVLRLLDAYHAITRQVLSAELQVSDVELISAAERALILLKFNATDAEFEAKTFHGLFEQQAARVPDAVAVVDDLRALTYAQLNARANQLAHHLIARGLVENSVVGVLLNRRVEAIVAMLGVMKAGAGYLPIEPGFPAPRVRYMLEDSRCAFLVTDAAGALKVPASLQIVNIHAVELASERDVNPARVQRLTDLAYVIYTSGSTGEPKGVPIHHEGVANLHHIFRSKFQIDEHDRMTEFASFSFDTSVWEIVMCILAGASLHILSDALKANYAKLEQYLAEHRITVATFPPTYLAYVDPAHVPSLRAVAVAGSECSVTLLRRWNTRVGFHNAYGPTEHSVCIAVFAAPRTTYEGDLVPIGRPLFNKRIYIVGPDRQLQPIGAPGELWVSGVGMSGGYLGQPDLTASRFVDNPFASEDARDDRHRIAYRTGDLARWREDGTLEFIGRLDNQVKVRGYRIELDEVDSALLRVPGVEQAAAVVKPDAQGGNVLYAYYTAGDGMTASELRAGLATNVPEYLIPSHLIRVAALPMTHSDKVDRRALAASSDRGLEPAPAAAQPAAAGASALPAGATEARVAAAVSDALKAAVRSSEVDIAAPLDVLGIDSLLFMKIVVKLEGEYDLEFDEDFLLEGRSMTVKQIAELVDARRASA